MAGVEPVALEPPCEPLTGDSHAHLLAPLGVFAQSLGYAVSFERIEGSAGGWCDLKNKRIVVDAGVPPNAQLRTLIHECAHALRIDYQRYSRAQAEVMVDTVTLLAASSVGLAVDGETKTQESSVRCTAATARLSSRSSCRRSTARLPPTSTSI